MILKLGMHHLGLKLYQVCINDDPGFTLTRSNLVTWAFLKEKVRTVDFSDTIAACDQQNGRCRQLVEFIKVCESSRSMSFLDSGPWSFTYKN